MKDLYSEHYKILPKEVKENLQMDRYKLLFFICRFCICGLTFSLGSLVTPSQ